VVRQSVPGRGTIVAVTTQGQRFLREHDRMPASPRDASAA
jgi:hypothetical protein